MTKSDARICKLFEKHYKAGNKQACMELSRFVPNEIQAEIESRVGIMMSLYQLLDLDDFEVADIGMEIFGIDDLVIPEDEKFRGRIVDDIIYIPKKIMDKVNEFFNDLKDVGIADFHSIILDRYKLEVSK